MRRTTRLRSLTIDEVLEDMRDRRESSDIIEELCQRIESMQEKGLDDDINTRASCPVCDANLDVEIDEANLLCTLHLAKE